ncbi:Cro/CI family transcriptional regulator [Acinetobacter corruptisaponis]|uniref:Cro/CI family transcriptional regulator n=1 Tax=Acinetobacter corruptisaponis TaxID=3045147 RepID=A0ABY8S3Q9_9GAMM|nr:Cro/CI family transcriptional regulator [Acinetobacter sp. KCTC 92772]WHP06345.1 Cro/CI family transcriptional regulator [Acinetobacter sp. KCTC 92772]
MNDDQFIELLGGVTAVARLLGITAASVSGWKAIPMDRKIRLAVIAEDKGLCTRKDLFPNTYQDIWIELRSNHKSNLTHVAI